MRHQQTIIDKDEIIDKAANMLADRFQRTKKYREAMDAAIEKDGE